MDDSKLIAFTEVVGRMAYSVRDAWYIGEFTESDEEQLTSEINGLVRRLGLSPDQAKEAYNLLDPVARDILDSCTAEWLFEE